MGNVSAILLARPVVIHENNLQVYLASSAAHIVARPPEL